jgi:glutathione synthase/RimK-type ligase-like ATP-grasp enzyme
LSGTPFLCQFVDEVKERPNKRYNTDFKYILTQKLKILPENCRIADKSVLILGSNMDIESDLVGVELFRRGIDYIRLNTEDIPCVLGVSYSVGHHSATCYQLKIGSTVVDLSDISVVLLRNFDYSPTDYFDNHLNAEFIRQQWNDAIQILHNSMSCEWINSPSSIYRANNRMTQLEFASNIGFNIPATLITNDPDRARSFYYEYNGDVILKPLHHHSIEVQDKLYSIYVHSVSNDDLSKFDDLQYAPCILQQKLSKHSEVRVTVVGEQVFAVQIESASDPAARDDIHRARLSCLLKRPIQLCEEDEARCIKIIRYLGLKYGTIDLVVGEDDRLTFLEINPTGDWFYIEHQTKIQITRAVVNLIEATIRNSLS